jgi:hypothetical protein
MIEIFFEMQGTRQQAKVSKLGPARIIWDALSAAGYDMISKRP